MSRSKRKRKSYIFVILIVILLSIATTFMDKKSNGGTEMEEIQTLNVTSPSFLEGEEIPKKHTGFDVDVSPEFNFSNLSEEAVSIAIIMDDLDIPIVGTYNHWVIWNIPPVSTIPEGISHGEIVEELGNATQGNGWGKNRYRGPKQPVFINKVHRYIFRFYVLDTTLELDGSKGKDELQKAMEGHVLQYGSLTGWYKREGK